MVSASTENYLATIYRLTRETPAASTKDIAESLGLSPPSVSEKIIRLAEEGYLDHKWRQGVSLTEKGTAVALQVLRKHRVIESFLVKILNYSIEEVNEEAHRLEHAVSHRLIDAMEALLEYPKTDPHGHPIPSKEGTVAAADFHSLAEQSAGKTVQVSQVSDQERERLRYLTDLGIVPGARITVVEAAPFEGPLTIDVDGTKVVIALDMARTVGVRTET
jgi:DtxR family Mn-dependent transcriptional regulator